MSEALEDIKKIHTQSDLCALRSNMASLPKYDAAVRPGGKRSIFSGEDELLPNIEEPRGGPTFTNLLGCLSDFEYRTMLQWMAHTVHERRKHEEEEKELLRVKDIKKSTLSAEDEQVQDDILFRKKK